MPEPTNPAESRQGSALGNLVNALISPREAFESLAKRPTFALAMIVLVALTTILSYIAMSKVTPADFLKTLEESGRQLPPNAQEHAGKFLAVATWGQVGASIVIAPLVYLAVAGIFLVIFRMAGSEISFRQSLATTIHGMLPFGVLALVGIAVTLGREQLSLSQIQSGQIVASNLGFLAGDQTSKAIRALLTSVDLFSVWCIALLAIGYRVVAKIRGGTAWAGVLGLWIVGVLIKVGLSAIF